MLVIALILFSTLSVEFGSTTKWDLVWPWPQSIDQQDHYLVIEPQKFHISTDSKCELVHEAIKRQLDRMFVQDCGKLHSDYVGQYFIPRRINRAMDMYNGGELLNLTVTYDGDCEQWPHMNMAEKYRLSVERGGVAVLHGESIWAVLRGLETFAQLLHNSGRDEFLINLVKIEDYPRFSHRGLLIDSSRHFLPLRSIRQTLDSMEMNKFNVLHWHIVDDQSFPFVSETFPELSGQGSYDPNHMTYSVEEVEGVLEYARLRGIRVLVEFDTPGHTRSWGQSHPDLLTTCYDAKGKPTGELGPVDPTKDENYSFIAKLFTEISRRFPDQFLHLGGDEVPFDCWESNPAIKEFMVKHGMDGDYSKLESFYIQKLVEIVQQLKKSYIVWQEVFDNNVTLKADTVVHVWIAGENLLDPQYWPYEMERVVKSGHHALLSAPWYLDWISWKQDWIGYYQTEPLNFTATPEQKKLVLGGEACIWGEFVDGSNLISKTWPRASSIAERLWSDASVNDAEKARPRFHGMECRLQREGMRVGPIDGPGHCQCDYAL